jgi:hypothetical protein
MPAPSTPVELLRGWLAAVAPVGAGWVAERCRMVAGGGAEGWRALAIALGQAGRHTGRAPLAADLVAAVEARPGWDPSRWSADQAARSLLLLAWPAEPVEAWQHGLDQVFAAATVEEAVAFYQTLPLLPRPARLAARAAEGVRSSLQPVFAAVALDNPYPAEALDDGAFAQLVLKAFFVGAEIGRIHGLDRRRTPELGRMLADYARERRAAGRPVDPLLPPLARACGAECPDTP